MSGSLSGALDIALKDAGIEIPKPPVIDGVEINRELEPELIARLSVPPITGALVKLTNRAIRSFQRHQVMTYDPSTASERLYMYVNRCTYVPERPAWVEPMRPRDGTPIENWGFLIVDDRIAMPLGIARSPRHAVPLFVLDCLFVGAT